MLDLLLTYQERSSIVLEMFKKSFQSHRTNFVINLNNLSRGLVSSTVSIALRELAWKDSYKQIKPILYQLLSHIP